MNQADTIRYALGIIALPLSLVLLVVGVRMIIQGRSEKKRKADAVRQRRIYIEKL